MAKNWNSGPMGFSWNHWNQHTFPNQPLDLDSLQASTSSGDLSPDSGHGTIPEGSPPLESNATPEEEVTEELFDWVVEKSIEANQNITPAEKATDLPKAESKTPAVKTRKKASVRFSNEQIDVLVNYFHAKTYLSKKETKVVAEDANISCKQVRVWFQNQRAKRRKDINWMANPNANTQDSLAVQTTVPPLRPYPQFPVQPDYAAYHSPDFSSFGSTDYYQFTTWQQYTVAEWARNSSAQPLMSIPPLFPK